VIEEVQTDGNQKRHRGPDDTGIRFDRHPFVLQNGATPGVVTPVLSDIGLVERWAGSVMMNNDG
jgi:hypothetical protein